jgi:hypothetical protein
MSMPAKKSSSDCFEVTESPSLCSSAFAWPALRADRDSDWSCDSEEGELELELELEGEHSASSSRDNAQRSRANILMLTHSLTYLLFHLLTRSLLVLSSTHTSKATQRQAGLTVGGAADVLYQLMSE